MADSKQGVAIGIDLGTTYSCVSIFTNGRVKVMADKKSGERVIPSFVVFTDKGYVVGKEAKDVSYKEDYTCVYEVKRLMGRTFNDPLVQEDIKRWPFDVVDQDGKPHISVCQNSKYTLFSPEEISALIIGKMKNIAETYLKGLGEDEFQPVTNAVITVPAYFNDSQRQATKTAAKLAGLEVLRIINEPTAAAMAYGFKTKPKEEECILVFDLGGGTFDVSIIQIEDGIIQVLATGGDTHLGGADFDNAVADRILDFFNESFNIDPKTAADQKQLRKRLIKAIEFAKCQVSQDNKSEVKIDEFFKGKDLEYSLRRQEFEKLNHEMFLRTIPHVEEVMKEANLTPDQIDHVVLVGGSTRIPMIQKLVREFFRNKKLNKSINPDEAVAHGAALMCAILTGQRGVDDTLLMDVTPLTLGVDVKGGIMMNIIPRNTSIPARGMKSVTTIRDNQETVTWGVYQGERPVAKENHYLGTLSLDGIEPAPAGVPSIEVTFDLDTDGILTTSARNKDTGAHCSAKIDHNKAHMGEKDAAQVLKVAKEHLKEDTKERDRIMARNTLESFIQWIQYLLKESSYNMAVGHKYRDDVLNRCGQMSQWLKLNEDSSEEEFKEQHKITLDVCKDLPGNYLTPGQLPHGSKVIKRNRKPIFSSTTLPKQYPSSDDEEKIGDLD